MSSTVTQTAETLFRGHFLTIKFCISFPQRTINILTKFEDRKMHSKVHSFERIFKLYQVHLGPSTQSYDIRCPTVISCSVTM